jgi:hypothetical protein
MYTGYLSLVDLEQAYNLTLRIRKKSERDALY